MAKTDVVIVGGGLSGLCCALRLEEKGLSCRILEAADRPGGRVRTDKVTGYQLDRGFQVLLTAYPEARQKLDYGALELGSFHPGALIRWNGKFHKFSDPWRKWADALSTLLSPAGSLGDKLKMQSLRRKVCSGSLEELYNRPETTTLEELESLGFSSVMIQRFFRPFLGGIFLEADLATSSRKFEFVFRMFSQGSAALPASGMQAIPDQLVSRLHSGTLRTNSRVASIEDGRVRLVKGEVVEGDRIVLATDEPAATDLRGMARPERVCPVTCFYYAARETPVAGPWLVLNGEDAGPINNLCVPSEVRPEYAPEGQALVSVTVIGARPDTGVQLESEVRAQLTGWYGDKVAKWRLIKAYKIAYALPFQPPPSLSPVEKPAWLQEKLFVCGDHADTASIQGAMASGRRCADAIIGMG